MLDGWLLYFMAYQLLGDNLMSNHVHTHTHTHTHTHAYIYIYIYIMPVV